VHPDVTISCDKRDSQTVNNIQYPRTVIEVLSPSTEAKDKGEKLLAYLACPSLEEYMLIDSRTKFVEVYHKDKNKWTSVISQSDDSILLPSISLEISLEDIYAKTGIN
jgi:Uma2 family endonuclease